MPTAERRVAWWLFAGLALVYVAITGGHVYEPDGVVMARTAESLVERGSLAIEDPGYPPGFLIAGGAGRRYGKYGVGLPIAAVPFHLLGRALAVVAPAGAERAFAGPRFLWYDAGDRERAFRFAGVALTNAVAVAATCAVLYLLVLELGYAARPALGVALVIGLASPLVVYAKTFFTEPLAALGSTLLALGIARWRNRPRTASAALAGLGFAIAVLAKTAHVVLLPVVVIAAWLAARRSSASATGSPVDAGSLSAAAAGEGVGGRAPQPSRAPRPAVWTHALAAVAPLAVVLALLAALNLARFGSPFETGYGREVQFWSAPWLEGLLGLLIAPGRGLLFYFPAVLLAAAGTPALVRRAPWAAALGWGGLVTMLAVYCRWHAWEGGWCWGPRFLVPLLPLLALPLAAWWEALPDQDVRGVARWGGLVVVAVGALFNWTGTLVPFTDYHQLLKQVFGAPYMAVARWSWQAFPPRVYWQVPKTYWLLPAALRTPEARAIAAVLVAAGALGIAALVMATRRGRGARS
jgi:hypothetical protein